MPTVSFSRAKAAAPVVEAEPVASTSTAVATIDAAPPPAPYVQSKQLEGEFSSRDLATPYLGIGQKTSKTTDDHPEWVGKWIYDKATCLGDTVKAVAIRMRKYYEEVTEYDSGDIPQRWRSAAEAEASGLEFRDVADIDLLIEAETEHDCAIELAGKLYLPARLTVRSSSYKGVVGVIMRDLKGWLKADLASGYYEISTKKVTTPKNSWYVPTLSTAGKVPEDLRAAIASEFDV